MNKEHDRGDDVRINMRGNVENTEYDKWLMDLIWVITWQEILRRRREYRKYRKKFY